MMQKTAVVQELLTCLQFSHRKWHVSSVTAICIYVVVTCRNDVYSYHNCISYCLYLLLIRWNIPVGHIQIFQPASNRLWNVFGQIKVQEHL